MRTYFRELVDYRPAADYRPVIDIGLTGKADETYEDAVVADSTVMGYVHIRHDKYVVANLGNAFSACIGTPVNRGALPYCHIIPYLDIRHFSIEFEILRGSPDYRSRINRAVPAHFHILENISMREKFAPIAYHDIALDIAERPDLDVVSNLGTRMHNSCRMYFLRHFYNVILNTTYYHSKSCLSIYVLLSY